jgi:hypothetical protein
VLLLLSSPFSLRRVVVVVLIVLWVWAKQMKE